MTKAVWKYPLEAAASVTVQMPQGAQILCVQVQHDTPTIWALVDTSMPFEKREFHTYGTGHEIPDSEILAYVGSWQLHGGAYVFHTFEKVIASYRLHEGA